MPREGLYNWMVENDLETLSGAGWSLDARWIGFWVRMIFFVMVSVRKAGGELVN